MAAKPVCKALLVCEKVEVANGKTIIVNIVDAFEFVRYPGTVKDVSLFMYLTSATGKCDIRIELIDAHNQCVNETHPVECEFVDHFTPRQLHFPIEAELPHEGAYDFVVFASDQEIDRFRIEARLR